MPPRHRGRRRRYGNAHHRPSHRPPHRPSLRPRPPCKPPLRPPILKPPIRPTILMPPLIRPPKQRTKWLLVLPFIRSTLATVTPSTSTVGHEDPLEVTSPPTVHLNIGESPPPPPYTVDPDGAQVTRMGAVSQFTRAEVSTRNGRDNGPIWVIIRDSVYDVTNYIHEHPGGGEPILEQAGKDATKDFDDIGHSIDAKTIMTKYKIGEIVEEEKYYDANGKKKKRVVSAAPEETGRSCLSIVTCGLMG